MTNSHYSSSFTPWDDIQVEDLHDTDAREILEIEEEADGCTAEERDEAALHNLWREECFANCTDDDDHELIAVFGADDPDNYLGEAADEDCA